MNGFIDQWADPAAPIGRVPLSLRLDRFNDHPDATVHPFYGMLAQRKQIADARCPGVKGRRILHKLIVSRSDADAARRCATQFLRLVRDMKADWDLYSPLMEAAVIAYARPFTDSEGGAGPLKKCWREYFDHAYRDLHHQVLEMRRELVAHSDPRVRKVVLSPAPIALPGAVIPKFNVEVSTYLLERDQIGRLANLSYMLGKHLDHAIGLALPTHFPDRTFGEPFPLIPGE